MPIWDDVTEIMENVPLNDQFLSLAREVNSLNGCRCVCMCTCVGDWGSVWE